MYSYGKPNLTNLPIELGKRIFKHILSTPPLDIELLKKKGDEQVRQMKRALEKEKDA